MIPLLPETPSLSPSPPLPPGLHPLAAGGEGSAIDFAALLGAALPPAPVQGPNPLPQAGTLLAGIAEPSPADVAGPISTPPPASPFSGTPVRQDLRLPTGRNLPLASALLPAAFLPGPTLEVPVANPSPGPEPLPKIVGPQPRTLAAERTMPALLFPAEGLPTEESEAPAVDPHPIHAPEEASAPTPVRAPERPRPVAPTALPGSVVVARPALEVEPEGVAKTPAARAIADFRSEDAAPPTALPMPTVPIVPAIGSGPYTAPALAAEREVPQVAILAALPAPTSLSPSAEALVATPPGEAVRSIALVSFAPRSAPTGQDPAVTPLPAPDRTGTAIVSALAAGLSASAEIVASPTKAVVSPTQDTVMPLAHVITGSLARRMGVDLPVAREGAPDPARLASLAAALPEVTTDSGSNSSGPSLGSPVPAPASAQAAHLTVAIESPTPPAQPMPTLPLVRFDPRVASPAPGPQQQSTIDQVGDLREALRSARPAMMLNHAEFGAVSLRLEAGGGGEGWRAVLASRDPGFVPAIQHALAERAVAAPPATSPDSGALAGQGGAFHNGTGEHRSGSSLSGGQGTLQPYLGQSGPRDGEAAPDHRRPSTVAALAARVEVEESGSAAAGQASPSGGLFA